MIISGGQTGADRGGLDAAIVLGIPHGGWCPKGRRAEDGVIPAQYGLRSAPGGYRDRTRRNVEDADATIVFVLWDLTPGSLETVRLAIDQPCEIVRLKDFVLNVAGSRESKCPGIQNMVRDILVAALRG